MQDQRPSEEESQEDELMLDVEKFRADVQFDQKRFATEQRRTSTAYTAAGAGVLAGGATLFGGALDIYRAT